MPKALWLSALLAYATPVAAHELAEDSGPYRDPPSLVLYAGGGAFLGGVLGLGTGILAVNLGLRLGGSGFLNLSEIGTPFVFTIGGVVAGSVIGWILFHRHLADFNEWQRTRFSLFIAPGEPGRGGWQLGIAGRL